MAKLLINSYHGLTMIGPYTNYFGWLYTPRLRPTQYNRSVVTAANIVACADNDAFNGLDIARYKSLLQDLQDINIQWITAPDKVGDAVETTKLFYSWYDDISQYPIAYVLQDGVTVDMIPWDYISCVFLGGSTEFKLSLYARSLLYVAKTKNKFVHVGRVNSIKRIKLFWDICDSFDGSGFSRYSKAMLPKYIRFLEEKLS